MSTIRNLIIKEWFRFFIGSFIILVLLITVAELISGFLRSNVTPLEVILNHLLEMTDKFKLITPVGCLAASLFSINKLKNRNELTAIFAAGYSRKKFITDIVFVASVVALGQFLISSFIDPYAKSNKDLLIKDGQAKFKNLKSKGLMASTIGSGRMWFKSEHYFFSFSTFDKIENRINDVIVYYFDDNNLLNRRVESESITFKNNRWITPEARIFKELANQEFPEIINEQNTSLAINERPSDFKEIEADITTLNVFKLYHYISRLKKGGINVNEYMIMLLEKFSTALICVIFSLVAAIGIFTPNRRGSSFGKSLFKVFVFVILYWLINSYFMELGKSSKLNPYLACFGVPIVFTLYITHYFIRHKKLK